jgi:hypothetical protein
MSRLLRLYPAAWRARYGEEYTALLEELPADGRVALDVLRLAVRLRLRQASASLHLASGDPSVTDSFLREGDPHARRLAALGLLLAMPSFIFLSFALLKYWLGIPGPFDAIGDLVEAPLIEPLTVVGPFFALAVALWSVARVRMRWVRGTLGAVVTVHARLFNLAIVALAALLSTVIIVYGLIENF